MVRFGSRIATMAAMAFLGKNSGSLGSGYGGGNSSVPVTADAQIQDQRIASVAVQSPAVAYLIKNPQQSVEVLPDGSVEYRTDHGVYTGKFEFEGRYLNIKQGIVKYDNGDSFEGFFKNGHPDLNKEGKWSYASGIVFEQHGNGKGELRKPEGTYKGSFKYFEEGSPERILSGSYTDNFGHVFEGSFNEDGSFKKGVLNHGSYTFNGTFREGRAYKGVWEGAKDSFKFEGKRKDNSRGELIKHGVNYTGMFVFGFSPLFVFGFSPLNATKEIINFAITKGTATYSDDILEIATAKLNKFNIGDGAIAYDAISYTGRLRLKTGQEIYGTFIETSLETEPNGYPFGNKRVLVLDGNKAIQTKGPIEIEPGRDFKNSLTFKPISRTDFGQ